MNHQNLQYQKIELYPTIVMRFNGADLFTQQEVETLKQEIDEIVENKTYMQLNELTPKWQSKPILFNEKYVKNYDLWKKLDDHFRRCCITYMETNSDIIANWDNLHFASTRAWFYKNDGVVGEDNPIHNHNPSFLSGVFYLDVPEVPNYSGGTVFIDPRRPLPSSMRDIEVGAINLTWVIFPGWMDHRSGNYSVEEAKKNPRYVIAADSYVAINS